MDREDVFNYIKEKYHTKPAYLWEKYPFYAALRTASNKWYGIVMNVPKNKLGLEGTQEIDILVVKCYPEMIGGLRKSKGFLPAYHMNKEHWITIVLDEKMDKDKIKFLIDQSYELVN